MAAAEINLQNQQLSLRGVLDYRTAPALLRQGKALIASAEGATLEINCTEVSKSSSVGLALVLAFMREGLRGNKQLSIVGLPKDMQQIAEVCQVSPLLAATTK